MRCYRSLSKTLLFNFRLFSGLSCARNEQCWGPKGNLWAPSSLNYKIYRSCMDIDGMCEQRKCRGFDTSLHACGLANWIICGLIK